MRIGVLTFHRAINYGAVLQCYGLQETLKALGHSVEIIDYRPEYVEAHRHILSILKTKKSNKLFGKIKLLIVAIINVWSRIEADCRFDRFLNESFSFSKVVLDRKDMPYDYDYIIIGSDQVWSPKICNGLDPIFWGQFYHGRAKLVAYATSIGGIKEPSEKEWELIKRYIHAFESVSVRENAIKFELEKRLNIPIQCCLDPSLLLDKSQYELIASEPEIRGEYVLAFSVIETSRFLEFANKVATSIKCPVVVMSSHRVPRVFRKSGNLLQLSPTIGGFLGLVKNAKCVITTSFHGTVFSIIFERPFYTADHHKSERVRNLLCQIGLEDRLVKFDEDGFCYSEINYEEPVKKLAELKERSRRYLVETIV